MTKRIPTYTPNAVLMNKQKTTKKGGRERFVPHQQRISVQDVRDASTPEGTAMVNEEFRRIALNINETQSQVEQLAADVPAAIKEAAKPAETPVAGKEEPSTTTIINNITEAGNTVTSADGSITTSETTNPDGSTNYDLDIWDYGERLESSFMPNPNGFDWRRDTVFPMSTPRVLIPPIEPVYTIVKIGSVFYYCTVSHTSSASFGTDLALGYWTQIPNWADATNYILDDLVVWVDGLVYGARSNHLSSALNSPATGYTYWYVPLLNDVYFKEVANRYPPVLKVSDTTDSNKQVDLRYITGDGWIPFEYDVNVKRIIKSNEIGVPLTGWIKKTGRIQYEHPSAYLGMNKTKAFFYFKPGRKGLYEVSCKLKLKIYPDWVWAFPPHYIVCSGMLALTGKENIGMVPATWDGTDYPLDYLNPVTFRVGIGDADSRHEEDIYCLLDKKDFKIPYYVRTNSVEPAPASWVPATLYSTGDFVTWGVGVYICLADHTSDYDNEPPNNLYWAFFGHTHLDYQGRDARFREFIDVELNGECLVWSSDGLTECYLPYYKIYLSIIQQRVDTGDVGHTIYNSSSIGNSVKIYDQICDMQVKYIGNEDTTRVDGLAYKQARIF